MLTLPIATESFESISRRDGKLANVADPIQEIEFSLRNQPQYARTDLPSRACIGSIEDIFGACSSK